MEYPKDANSNEKTLLQRPYLTGGSLRDVKFQLPFSLRCSQCSKVLYKGKGFSAQTRKIGKFFATDVVEFTLRCDDCSRPLILKTDPEHSSYSIVSGCTKYLPSESLGISDDTSQTSAESVVWSGSAKKKGVREHMAAVKEKSRLLHLQSLNVNLMVRNSERTTTL
mmetsp:Transcript_11985/g.22927  ORF Transcript_11985/g.22927 Transcript_11985/m.22927 type:complete len:166 (-) Transcript_11985:385-882(-)